MVPKSPKQQKTKPVDEYKVMKEMTKAMMPVTKAMMTLTNDVRLVFL